MFDTRHTLSPRHRDRLTLNRRALARLFRNSLAAIQKISISTMCKYFQYKEKKRKSNFTDTLALTYEIPRADDEKMRINRKMADNVLSLDALDSKA